MSSGLWSIITIIIGSMLTLGCLLAAFRNYRHKRIIDDCPTSKTQGIFIGLAELKGTAESEKPLTSYLAEIQCVQFNWHVDEHWSRIVHETYTDSKGNTHTRTRTESGWKEVAGNSQSIPFYLQDDTGVIRIVPEGADIQGTSVLSETCTPNDNLYFNKGPLQEISNTTHKRRFVETALPLHTRLYVMGQARERKDTVAAEIAYDRNAPLFLVSTRTEQQLSGSYIRWFYLWLILGLLVVIGGTIGWVYLEQSAISDSWQPYAIAVGSFIIALVLSWAWVVFNSLINLHNRVKQGWSQVEVQLKRRQSLIPNLVKSIQGFRDYENETQTLLTELRSQTKATPPGETGTDFKGIVPILNVIIEQYPVLKASESFLQLQRSLVDTEQRIALARDYYNDIVTFYNTRLDIIPDRFIAGLARLRPETLMSASDFERVPIHVNLAS